MLSVGTITNSGFFRKILAFANLKITELRVGISVFTASYFNISSSRASGFQIEYFMCKVGNFISALKIENFILKMYIIEKFSFRETILPIQI